MFKLLIGAAVAIAAFIGGLAAHPEPQNVGVALPSGVAAFETSLQSRISSTDSSMTLVSTSTRRGGSLSGYQCFTLDEGRTDAEYVCGTLTGAKTVTSLERGLDPLTGTTTNNNLKFAHRVGADIKITDFPLIQRLRNQASGSETYSNLLRYETSLTPASGGDLVDYDFVTGLAFSGAGIVDASNSSKGVVELALASEAQAGTANGSAGALALPASIATSTYNSATAAGVIPVTLGTGFLDQGFLPSTITKNLSISGTITYTGGATAFASSSIVSYVSSTTPTTTWTKPANLKYVRVLVAGPGGKGAAADTCAAWCSGGGAGGYGEKIIPAAALGSTETITVGGGASGVSSSFGSQLSCTAGTAASDNSNGSGGTCSNADFTIPGGSGRYGAESSAHTMGGPGGDSQLGRGGSGGISASAGAIANGSAGGSYGGGGGGCAEATDGSPGCSNGTATNGGDGAVIVYQYFY